VAPAVPSRPLLAPWYRIADDGERLLLEHGQRVVVLEGAAVRRLLPRLLPLLDGTRAIDELVAMLGAPARKAVDHAIETLAGQGLLTEGPDAPVELRSEAHAAAALCGVRPSVAAERLREAAVGVVGSAPAAFGVARLMHAEGVGNVSRRSWRDSSTADLVVVAPTADELEAVPLWNELALENELRWLPVLPYDGRLAGVGPIIVPGESCCYECVRLRRAANLEYGDDLGTIEAVRLATRGGAPLEAFAASVAAHLVVRWLVGRDPTVAGVLCAIEVSPMLSVTQHPVLRVPRCPVCSQVEREARPLPWHAAEAA
jgi:bacteriocin biosynthesis cyclodehydratase domain-containing protein